MGIFEKLFSLFSFKIDETGNSRYKTIKRNLSILMISVTFIPFFLMVLINYFQYRTILKREIFSPLQSIENKAKHSLELFIQQRVATVSFIAKAYKYNDLIDSRKLIKIFKVISEEFKGFVDIGVLNEKGIQVNYIGPYSLKGKDYSQQQWFKEVMVKGVYISHVFLGYRRFPHMVIAVKNYLDSEHPWVLRATIDTACLNDVILSMGLSPETDAFLVNYAGILQTPSKFYGKELNKIPFAMPPLSYQPSITSITFITDKKYKRLFLVYVYLKEPKFVLMIVKPVSSILTKYTALRGEIIILFILGTGLILFVIIRLTVLTVDRIKEADEKREKAFKELEHHQKLSSLGRLAAGVAHEINNPLAIINEKSGLIADILETEQSFPKKEKVLSLIKSIEKSIQRCKRITSRLLGFAKRMDVQIERLSLNDLIKEVLEFLENEATYRNIAIQLDFAKDLPLIESDRGQLQQVFLNILNNSFEAVDDGGKIVISTSQEDEQIAVSITDNGCGMDEETLKHIFDPFFTAKKHKGTGLGLSITYGIVKRLGGEIKVSSRLNKGTTFVVYLPKKAPIFTKESL